MKLESFKLISPNRVYCYFADNTHCFECQLTLTNFLLAQNATFQDLTWLEENACLIY